MDTHYRHPEDANKIIYGEWVTYWHPYKGRVLATVQDIYHLTSDTSCPIDTSYTLIEEGIKYAKRFRCKVLYKNPSSGVGHVTETYSDRIRPLTEEENKNLAIFLSGDLDMYPLIIHEELLREEVKRYLKSGEGWRGEPL